MGGLHQWWTSLSEDSKVAIGIFVFGSVATGIWGAAASTIRWIYFRDLRTIQATKMKIHQDLNGPDTFYYRDGNYPVSNAIAIKRAGIPHWRAIRAIQWQEKQKFKMKLGL